MRLFCRELDSRSHKVRYLNEELVFPGPAWFRCLLRVAWEHTYAGIWYAVQSDQCSSGINTDIYALGEVWLQTAFSKLLINLIIANLWVISLLYICCSSLRANLWYSMLGKGSTRAPSTMGEQHLKSCKHAPWWLPHFHIRMVLLSLISLPLSSPISQVLASCHESSP